MRFESLEAFALFIPLAVLLILKLSRRKSDVIHFSTLQQVDAAGKTWKNAWRWLPSFLYLASIVFLICSLARPQMEIENTEQKNKGIAIQLVIDASSSMDIGIDFAGKRTTRMEVAKKVVEQFVLGDGDSLDGRPNDLIGVIVYRRFADTLCPLTLGHDALVHVTNEISSEAPPNEDGTAYGDATTLAAARLKELEYAEESQPGSGVASKIIILLTDGENNCGRHLPLEAAAMAKNWGIKVYTISLGEAPDTKTITTDSGEYTIIENISATDKVLSRMSEQTGGVFRTAYDYDSLKAIYAEIDKLEKSEVQLEGFVDYKDSFFILIAALVCVLIAVLLDVTILRRLP